MTESPVVERVSSLVAPIASDLGLDVYDVERRGGTLRVTLDTPPGSPAGVDLDQLALATRLISRELDHHDPVPGKYTLEVTSPGLERTLRTPAHFRREVGKTINVRLANADSDQRRIEGVLVAADDTTATLRLDADADTGGGESVERVVELSSIDRARTVFVWGPTPKKGGKGAGKGAARDGGTKQSPTSEQSKPNRSKKEPS